ncbi:MAG: efflux RND transporter periplasmic adaptor subunit [Pseudomonadota bacterium]
MFVSNTSPSAPRKLLIGAAFATLVGCGGGGPGEMEMPPTSVAIAEVIARDVTDWDEFSGRIEAVETIEIRPRVTGYLTKVHFTEGALVEAGDLLFSIDDREYRAEATLTEADLARARTRLQVAEQEAARGEKLVEAKALSAEEQDRRTGELRQARADFESAKARLDRVSLDVEFTQLRAPISGRVGEALVRPGNLVTPGDTLLTTLVSVDPIHVVFEGDEQIYLKYQAQARSGERPSSRDARNPVQVGLASDTDYPYRGEMNFVDNQVDAGTGTIQGRAELPNPDGFLIPGLFARVRLLGSGSYEALMVHQAAILTDQDRKYVYVATPDNLAVRRDVVTGRQIDDLVVIQEGLEAGEQIVVNGVAKIFFSGAPIVGRSVPMETPFAESESTAAGATP